MAERSAEAAKHATEVQRFRVTSSSLKRPACERSSRVFALSRVQGVTGAASLG